MRKLYEFLLAIPILAVLLIWEAIVLAARICVFCYRELTRREPK
jgi:hypothetical protein